MGDLFRDPELDRLISEMNTEAPEVEGEVEEVHELLDPPSLREIVHGEPIEALLAEMVRRGASDLLLVPGSPPTLRIEGRLRPLAEDPLEPGRIEGLFASNLGSAARRSIDIRGCADFSLRLLPGRVQGLDSASGWRLRVNLQRQRGEVAAGVRLLPQRIPSLEELNLPPGLGDLVASEKGLVLVSGPTGSGKSTTLAALVDFLNRSREGRHIITIEDPVEYEHRSLHSVVEQVEVGTDAPDFGTALRAALRRDPDVILVGEVRDAETMAAALTAAETGHLILATLHTGDATRAVHRIVDVFPASRQDQIRQQLALALRAIVCQQLIPCSDGAGRVPALEVLIATYAVRNHIRKGRAEQLYNEMMTGRSGGMVQMEESLADLVRAGAISIEEARCRANRLDELERRLLG